MRFKLDYTAALSSLFLFIAICDAQACRFWVAASEKIPSEFITQSLIDDPYSLKKLGDQYPDGWSVGYYNASEDIVIRGDKSADYNKEYDDAVRFVASIKPSIVMAHLRRASSGCRNNVPDPHPFSRDFNQKKWLFGHNGGFKKEILINLIGEDYLKSHPPATCTENPPDSWVDSELFFIYLLKNIEENQNDVEKGLVAGLRNIYAAMRDKDLYLNFFLTDGEKLWFFRKGNTMFYQFDSKQKISVVSSTISQADERGWKALEEDVLLILSPNQEHKFINIFDY